MQYLKVVWLHDFQDEPYVIYSEIDSERYENRKLELYKGGKFGFATRDTEYGGTIITEHPYPTIEEIASSPEFMPEYISEEDFERVWKESLGKSQ